MNRPVPGLPGRFRFPRRLRATFEGKAFLALTLGVGIAAVNTGNNLLYLALSFNLSLILLSGALSEGTLRRIRLSVRQVSEAFAGEEAFLSVTCSAEGKRFPGFSLVASLRVEGKPVTVRFPDIPPGGTATRVIPFRPDRRGPLASIPSSVSTRFPFALFEKSAAVTAPAGILVYPRPFPAETARGAPPEAAPSGRPDPAGRAGVFPRGAREHLPSDPVRDIHWKATARTGRWMTKEREGEAVPVVDVQVPAGGTEERFEERLSLACGTVLALDRRGVPFRLRIGGLPCAEPGDPDRRGKALRALATARFDGIPPAPTGGSA
ncbi:MAG: DUF58 domain-containing protein [Deltaproteobacteria bacterium]